MIDIKKLKSLKERARKGLTVARLRTFKGFENITDEAGKEMIANLRQFCEIVLTQLNRLSTERYGK